jgi:solute carrier family 27 fatty acid transporter 1/4
MVGNGLRAQIWQEFTRRFQIPQIAEFYGSTEGNVGMMNPFNKVGACGVISVLLPFLNPVSLIKVDPDTGEYVRDSRGFCVKAGVNEPGEVVGRIRKAVTTTHFDGYSDSKASKKKVMSDVFSPGDQFFLSGDILRQDEDGYLYFCDRTGDTFRWKGENVSTTEVEAVITNILQLRDVVAYGVEVPGSEGRAGMAAIVGTLESVELSGLAQQLFLSLPAYAVPLFIRLIQSVELTGTFKLKKVKLRNEGFDISLSDPLFMLDSARKVYEPLTEELYQKLQNGDVRV